MNNIRVGRKVDISGINVNEIESWLKGKKHAKEVIKCQSIIALSKGVAMNEVCSVMGISRESVRKWKMQLRNHGIKGFENPIKPGKRSKLTPDKKIELKNILKANPQKYGYNKNKWTGLLVKELALDSWNLKISVRTAQLWLK